MRLIIQFIRVCHGRKLGLLRTTMRPLPSQNCGGILVLADNLTPRAATTFSFDVLCREYRRERRRKAACACAIAVGYPTLVRLWSFIMCDATNRSQSTRQKILQLRTPVLPSNKMPHDSSTSNVCVREFECTLLYVATSQFMRALRRSPEGCFLERLLHLVIDLMLDLSDVPNRLSSDTCRTARFESNKQRVDAQATIERYRVERIWHYSFGVLCARLATMWCRRRMFPCPCVNRVRKAEVSKH